MNVISLERKIFMTHHQDFVYDGRSASSQRDFGGQQFWNWISKGMAFTGSEYLSSSQWPKNVSAGRKENHGFCFIFWSKEVLEVLSSVLSVTAEFPRWDTLRFSCKRLQFSSMKSPQSIPFLKIWKTKYFNEPVDFMWWGQLSPTSTLTCTQGQRGLAGKEGFVGRPGVRGEVGAPGPPGERGPPGEKVENTHCLEHFHCDC